VFLLNNRVSLKTDEEVSSFKWVGLDVLASSESVITSQVALGSQTKEVPAIKVDDYVIWGLTHRIISMLLTDG